LACYGNNEGAAVVYTGNSAVAGGSSQVDLFTAAGPEAGRTIVHPFQLASNVAGSSDFFGWGTYRGEGTTGGLTNCPDNYNSGWHVYADGVQFQDYWCRGGYGDLPSSSANQEFAFRRTTCPYNGFTRFVTYLNGSVKTCALIDGTAGQLAVGGESVGTSLTQDIDVDYEALHYYSGGVWRLWGAGHDTTCGASSNDPPYFVITVSNSEFGIRSGI
jgi:hypothetical protein